MAPIQWRDERVVSVVEKMLRMYGQSMSVRLNKAIEGTEFLGTLKDVEESIEADLTPAPAPDTLDVLESLHSILVLYLWMSYRNPVTYHDHDDVVSLKARTESALDYCLEGMTKEEDAEVIPTWGEKLDQRAAEKRSRNVPYSSGFERRREISRDLGNKRTSRQLT
jgi:ATP-dependent RNA helicase SUPV3L1/SUV3